MTTKTKQEVLDILEAWQLLDFLNQSDLTKPHNSKKEPVFNKKGARVYKASYLFEETGNFEDSVTVEDVCNGHISKCKEIDSCLTSKSNIYIYVGKASRASIVNKLLDLLPEAEREEETPVDEDRKEIAALLLKLSPTGVFQDIEFSPLLWALKRTLKENAFSVAVLSVDEYNKEVEAVRNKLSENEDPLTWKEIAEIANKYAMPYLKAAEGSNPGSENINYRLVDFSILAPEVDSENEVSLFTKFFAEDIQSVRKTVYRRQIGDLRASSLSLAMSYIAGEASDLEKLDMRCNDSSESLSQFYYELLDPRNTPLGKWPSRWPLSLMQQSAVNLAAGRIWGNGEFIANDVVSVNGPPGTGKTTLLKDIIAANVVKKAYLLAQYKNPDDAFKKVKYKYAQEQHIDRTNYISWAPSIYSLKNDEINNYGIIVCSSNNAAVENISKELPVGSGLVKDIKPNMNKPEEVKAYGDVYDSFRGVKTEPIDWAGNGKEPDEWPETYFSRAAKEQFTKFGEELLPDEYPWALIAARLGKQKNIKSVANVLYSIYWLINKNGDEKKRYAQSGESFLKLYKEVEKELNEYSESFNRSNYLQDKLKSINSELNKLAHQTSNGKQKLNALKQEACESLKKARDLPLELNVGERPNSLSSLQALKDKYEAEAASLSAEIESVGRKLKAANTQREKVAARLLKIGLSKAENEYEAARTNYEALQPKRDKLLRLQSLNEEWNRLIERHNSLTLDIEKLESELINSQKKIDNLKDDQYVISSQLSRIDTKTGIDKEKRYLCPSEEFVNAFNSNNLVERKCVHLSNPTSNAAIDRKRELLFFAALQLTRDFILASSCMKKNILNLVAMWGKEVIPAKGIAPEKINFDPRDRKMAMPILFQSLLVITPVISSTFASIGRMFSDVEIDAVNKTAPFGLLVIDEAGQAVPMAALGALARCRKAVIVGDPLQIAPVVTDELNVLRKVWNDKVGREYVGKEASVQSIADERNPYGGWIHQDTDENDAGTWLGCPLVVHRRCISPMFDISNAVSYSGSMLNETAEPSKDERFCLASSQWINVSGPEQGKRRHYVEAQGKQAQKLIEQAFINFYESHRDKLEAKEDDKLPSLYVISPFKSVVEEMKKRSCPKTIKSGDWEKFCDENIGTVHTFQGKEASEVIFLLGCDKDSSGAIGWVPANIVNVAASRAKKRFYAIGDAAAWSANPSVRKMKEILDTQWISHYKKWKETDDIQELIEAKRLLPRGASIPGVIINDGSDEEPIDTSSYLANIENDRSAKKLMRIDDSCCRLFGFSSVDELEKNYSQYNRNILKNLEQGMFLYEMFDVAEVSGDVEDASTNLDYSFCAIMFCCAFESYLNAALLPRLKEFAADYSFGAKSKTLGARDTLTLGMYPSIIKDNAQKLSLLTASEFNEQWWKDFASNLEKFKNLRNKVGHADLVSAVEVVRMCNRLFGSPAVDNPPYQRLMREKDAFEKVEAGIKSGIDVSQVEQSCENETSVPERSASAPNDKAIENTNAYKYEDALVDSNEGTSPSIAISEGIKEGKYTSGEVGALLGKSRVEGLKESFVRQGFLEQPGGSKDYYPTERGFNRGIRWAIYKDKATGRESSGIRFTSDGVSNLKEFIANLIKAKRAGK